MLDQLLTRMPRLKKRWKEYQRLFTEVHVPARATLLRQGEISRKMYFVKQGCLRASIDNRGKDITFQFFFEHEMVA